MGISVELLKIVVFHNTLSPLLTITCCKGLQNVWHHCSENGEYHLEENARLHNARRPHLCHIFAMVSIQMVHSQHEHALFHFQISMRFKRRLTPKWLYDLVWSVWIMPLEFRQPEQFSTKIQNSRCIIKYIGHSTNSGEVQMWSATWRIWHLYTFRWVNFWEWLLFDLF